MSVSLPVPPVIVSARPEPMRDTPVEDTVVPLEAVLRSVQPRPVVMADRSAFSPLALMMAVPALVLALVAVQLRSSVALAVAPEPTCKISCAV